MLKIDEAMIKSYAEHASMPLNVAEEFLTGQVVPTSYSDCEDVGFFVGANELEEIWERDGEFPLPCYYYSTWRLRRAIWKAGYIFDDFIEASGLSRSNLFPVLMGYRDASIKTKKKLAEVLKMDIVEIWTDYKPEYRSTLEKIMDFKNITVNELADQTGIAPNTIRSYVIGRMIPGMRNAMRIADFLSIPIDDLVMKK